MGFSSMSKATKNKTSIATNEGDAPFDSSVEGLSKIRLTDRQSNVIISKCGGDTVDNMMDDILSPTGSDSSPH